MLMSSRLSKDLRGVYGFHSFPIHSQDVVTVKVGKFKNKIGKVESVNRETLKVTVEGCTMPKSSGGTVFYPIDPSNLVIKELFLDEHRSAALAKRKEIYDRAKANAAAKASSN